jgi:hypothetical protein
VSITIAAVNDAPVGTADTFTASVPASLGLRRAVPTGSNVLTNDTDVEGNTLTAVLVSGPTKASSFSLNADGTFSYTSILLANILVGTDSFTYYVTDGTNRSADTTVAIIIPLL